MLQLKFFLKLKWQEIIKPLIENWQSILIIIIFYIAGVITSFGINHITAQKDKIPFIGNFFLGSLIGVGYFLIFVMVNAIYLWLFSWIKSNWKEAGKLAEIERQKLNRK